MCRLREREREGGGGGRRHRVRELICCMDEKLVLRQTMTERNIAYYAQTIEGRMKKKKPWIQKGTTWCAPIIVRKHSDIWR